MVPPINTLMNMNAHRKMSNRVRTLLDNDDKDIANEAAKSNATVQRQIRHRRRKSLPVLTVDGLAKNVECKKTSELVEPITDDWDAFETVTFDGDDILDTEGRLLQRHKHRHYRRRRRHQDNLILNRVVSSASGSDSEEDIDEDVYVTYPQDAVSVDSEETRVANTYSYTIKVTHFHQLPTWLQDNEFLLSCHRLPLANAYDCARSMFSLHTETGNIWTHLLGCLLFVSIAMAFYVDSKQPTAEGKIVFGVFFVGAISCLGLSTAFHTMNCHDRLAHLFCKLDYVGISLLIVTSIIPWLYYGFYCRTTEKVFYICLSSAAGAVTIFVSLKDQFSAVEYRPLRALVFVLTAASGVVPVVHYWITDGYARAAEQLDLTNMGIMSLVYMVGALVYALRIPERFMPGKCDILFQSHQLFHLFVVAAAFMHYNGISEMASLRWKDSNFCMPVEARTWTDWLPTVS